MVKRVLFSTALVAALVACLSLVAAAQGSSGRTLPPKSQATVLQNGPLAPVGTEEPCIANPCTYYAGDFDQNGPNPNGLFNANWTGVITATTYVPFQVPKKFKGAKGKTDWAVTGLFVNEQMLDSVATSADWSIVQGVAAGGSPSTVTTICSGTGTPSVTPTGRIAFGFYIENTLLVTGITCPNLEAGTYWMTLLPTTDNPAYVSDVEDSTPANYEGPGISVIDDSFFYAPQFGFSTFTATAPTVCGGIGCDDFSVGVVATTSH